MRLQCPNCDAEYEVDKAAIPQEGRDVQCSNCGHGWFQMHPDFAPDPEMESALYDPPPPLPQARPSEGAYPRREIDPAAMQILREEAAREEALRARDLAAKTQGQGIGQNGRAMPAPQAVGQGTAQFGAQGGPQDVAQMAQADARITMPARAAMRRINRVSLQGDDSAVLAEEAYSQPAPVQPAPAQPIPAQPAPVQPEYKPSPPPMAQMIDPNTLQSTIRQQLVAKQKEADAGNGDAHAGKTRATPSDYNDYDADAPGFGRYIGMGAGIVLAALALAAYVFAPQLAVRAPQFAPYVEFYVNIVGVLRDLLQIFAVWAQGMLAQAVQAVMGLLSQG